MYISPPHFGVFCVFSASVFPASVPPWCACVTCVLVASALLAAIPGAIATPTVYPEKSHDHE